MTKACVFSLDDNYVLPFKVFFQSLIKTQSIPESVLIFILHTSSLNSESIRSISRQLSRYERTATFLDASLIIPSYLPIQEGSQYSLANYLRLFVGEILPSEVTHAVYLDSDMIAIQSISELFEHECESPIAAVDNLSTWVSERMWGDPEEPCFNSGVIWIPLQYWRSNQLSSQFIEIINEKGENLACLDQDVLNIAFKSNWSPLPLGYNVGGEVINSSSDSWLSKNAKLIHFSGPAKPWNSCKPKTYHYTRYLPYWDLAYTEVFGVKFNREQFKTKLSCKFHIISLKNAVLRFAKKMTKIGKALLHGIVSTISLN